MLDQLLNQHLQLWAHATAGVDAEGLLDIEAYGATLLTEREIGYFAHVELSAAEITYLLARSAGMSDDQLSIPDLDELPVETFEVIAPLYGVTAAEPTELVGVTVVPADNALPVLTKMGFDADELEHADSYALSLHTQRLGFHAERAGLERSTSRSTGWRPGCGTDLRCCPTKPRSRSTARPGARCRAAASWSPSAGC